MIRPHVRSRGMGRAELAVERKVEIEDIDPRFAQDPEVAPLFLFVNHGHHAFRH